MNRSIKNALACAFAALIALSACRAAPAGAGLSVRDAWARPTAEIAMGEATATPMAGMGNAMTQTESMGGGMAMNGPVSAAYLVIENQGGQADRLVSARATVAAVAEIHETYQKDDGMMSMRPVQGGLEIPANGSVELKPGGYHIMLMSLTQDLAPGQSFSLTLAFLSGRQIIVNVPVKEP